MLLLWDTEEELAVDDMLQKCSNSDNLASLIKLATNRNAPGNDKNMKLCRHENWKKIIWLQLFNNVWNSRRIPYEWGDSQIINVF
jgi:hypothetical protein